MDYGGGHGRGRGGRGRGRGGYREGGRDRSFSPPPQRRSPDYGRYGNSGGGRGGGRHGRREPEPYGEGWRGRDRDGPDDRGPRRPYDGSRDRRGGFGGRDGYGGGGGGYGGGRGPYRDGSRERDFDHDRDFDRFDREGPPNSPRYPDGDRGSPAQDEPNKVLSKTMFIKRYIDEDLDDHEIDRRYTDYLAGVYKSKNKAAFERQKNEDEFKRKFDPFMFKEEVEQRSRTAQTTAVKFGKAMAEGKHDWTADGKQQLLLPSEFKKASAQKTPCPVISWVPEIISVCWKIAGELIVKLDAEKGIRQELFDWIEAQPEAKGDNDDADMEPEDKDKSKDKDGDSDAEEGAAREPKSRNVGEANLLTGAVLEGDALAAHTGQLDVMLDYLWQVHGVDFYSGEGGELSVELYKSVKEQLLRNPPEVEFRAVRVQKPRSGNLVDEKRRSQVVEEFHHNVSKPWIERLNCVDADTQKALDLDAQLDAAVDVAVQKMLDKAKSHDSSSGSYKCQFCDKKFKGEAFLVKHVNNKHKEDFDQYKDEERDKAREELFFENFESHIKNEQESGAGMDSGGAMRGMDGMPRPPMPIGGGPIPPMMPPFGMMHPMMAMAMAQMMPNMMMGGPGRGMMAPGMGPPPGGRGGPGRGGSGRGGGRGGRGGPRQYFDFDAPANQRESLNYGDI